MKLLQQCLLLLLSSLSIIPQLSTAFVVKKSGPRRVTVKQGGDLDLSCTVDDWYEWCTFKHNGKVCDFEWKRDVYNITLLECSAFAGRYEFTGTYKEHNCAIRIKNVTPEDAGEWTCELENYYAGQYRGYGYKAEAKMKVEVEVPTTTTTTSTTTTTTTTTKKSSNNIDDYEENSKQDHQILEDTEENEEEEIEASLTWVLLGVFLVLLICLFLILFALHYTRKLPPACYNWQTLLLRKQREENPEKKHQNIVKYKFKTPQQQQPSEMGPMGESSNMNPDVLTAVTWTPYAKKENKEEEEEVKEEEEEKKPLKEGEEEA